MTRIEGFITRFFFNPVTNTAMFRMRGEERVYHVTVPPHYADFDDFVMSRPGDEVSAEIDTNDQLESWFNDTYLTNPN
jgi:hypothetical protein